MALRNQPYFPLYAQDFMTDEKLSECSAESTGVYIRLMCILHKQETYGSILLKQKYKQNAKQTQNFATMLARQMPYDVLIIERALDELVSEDVIQIDGDCLLQKRMVKDGELSDIRASAGSKGGKAKNEADFAIAKTQANTQAKPVAKPVANTEYESESTSEYEIEYVNTSDQPRSLRGGAGGDDSKDAGHPSVRYCAENLQGMSSGNMAELREYLADGMSDELVKFAVDEVTAQSQNKHTWAYLRKVLNRFVVDGIKTVGEAKAAQEQFNAVQATPIRGSPSKRDQAISLLDSYINSEKGRVEKA